MVHAYNPGCSKEEARVLVWVCGQPGIHNEFQNIKGYIMKYCLKTKTKVIWIHAYHFQVNIKAFFQNFWVRSAQLRSLFFFSVNICFSILSFVFLSLHVSIFNETHLDITRSIFKSTSSINHLNSVLKSYCLVSRWIDFSRSFTLIH